MAKYRKKPVVIEAFQLTMDTRWSNMDWPEWMHKAWNYESTEEGALFCKIGVPGDETNTNELYIQTLEGEMTVQIGDFIIQGVKGELYPCKPDIFEATYDKEEE
jgi:hypothetical protein